MRVLLCTQRLPYAANRGDRVRALNILRLLARHADVDLLSFVHDRDEEARAGDLNGLAASITTIRLSRWRGYAASLRALPTQKPFTHAILDAQPPDVVLPYESGMARLALASPLTAWPFVLDMVDVDSEKWPALAGAARPPMRWIYASEARRLAAFETVASMRAHAVSVVNDRECDAVRRLAPNVNVHIVPVGVNVDELCPPDPPTPEPRVVFCGVMNPPPHERGRCAMVGPRGVANRASSDTGSPIIARGRLPDARRQAPGDRRCLDRGCRHGTRCAAMALAGGRRRGAAADRTRRIGCRTDGSSRHGTSGLMPYTLLDEAPTNLGTFQRRASSSTFWVPITFTC